MLTSTDTYYEILCRVSQKYSEITLEIDTHVLIYVASNTFFAVSVSSITHSEAMKGVTAVLWNIRLFKH